MIARAALQIALVRGAMLVAGLIASIVTARSLGPDGRGQYYLMMTLASFAAQLASLGLHASNTYLVARDGRLFVSLIANSFWVSLVVGFPIAVVVAWLAAPGDSSGYSSSVVYWASAYAPAVLLILLVSTLNLGIGRTGRYNAIQVASSLLTVLAVCGAAVMSGDVYTFAAMTVIAGVVAAVAALAVTRISPTVLLKFDASVFRQGFSFAAKAFLVGLLSFLFMRANVFTLSRSAPADELGYYSIALQFADVLAILPSSVGAVLFPSLMRSDAPWRETVRCALWTSLIMFAACISVAALAGPLIRIAFGPEFLPAVAVTRMMLPAVLFMAAVTVLSQFLASAAYPREIIGIWSIGLIVVFVLGTRLSVRFGALGASAALSIAYLLVLILVVAAAVRLGNRSDRAARSVGARSLP